MNAVATTDARPRLGATASAAIAVLAAGLAAAPALAQSSASYALEAPVLNAGGHPAQGTTLASPSFRITLGSVGEGLLDGGGASLSFRLDGGFCPAFRPPGEVGGLALAADGWTLSWSPEASVGSYNLYRDSLGALSGLGYGSCLQHGVIAPIATDAALPASRSGYFYLVTAQNRLDEEGTKGRNSAGGARGNSAPCP